ncbi:hypothetical protein MPSEU_000922200 [Mayamaea pseudoterrestris]|nr:hypothetical protein MPSEU_000922200 [Mayamaea pseudoterrestris]
MLPTLAPDGSDIYLKSAWHKTVYYQLLQYLFPSLQLSYAVGDLVGLSHPHYPHHVSCKRVVGVVGDEVQRYGEYVHLFEEQDPINWGITWPPVTEQVHSWMDRSCGWDATCNNDGAATAARDPRRKIVVFENTVWVEGDCPGLAIDSRQYGPVPLDWIQGKIVGRLWPFWRKQNELPKRVRPHPISLDDETLRIYNVNRISATAATVKADAQP